MSEQNQGIPAQGGEAPRKEAREDAIRSLLCRAALRGWRRGRRNQNPEQEEIADDLLLEAGVASEEAAPDSEEGKEKRPGKDEAFIRELYRAMQAPESYHKWASIVQTVEKRLGIRASGEKDERK